MAWKETPGVLHLGTPLQHGLCQISELAQKPQNEGHENDDGDVEVRDEESPKDQRDENGSQNCPGQPLNRFLWADLWIKLMPTYPGPHQKCRDISSPDRGDEKKDPRLAFDQVPD